MKREGEINESLKNWLEEKETTEDIQHLQEAALNDGKELAAADQLYFKYMAKSKQVSLPEKDEEWLSLIMQEKMKKSSSRRYYWLAAASVVLVIASTIWFRPFSTQPEDTFDDPQVAFEETKKIMMMLSSNMNKGQEYAVTLGEFSKAQEQIKENKKDE